MNRRSVIGLVGLLVLGQSHAQRDCIPGTPQMAYVEALGPGGYGSLNYERQLYGPGPIRLHARAGVGAERIKDYTRTFNPDLAFPAGIIFTTGHRWQWELGGGGTITSFVYPREQDLQPERIQAVHGWLNAGVRLAPPVFRGWVFRMAYTPLVEFGRWRHWGGLSAGYKFK